ncbi:MAG: aldolase [Caldimonas sp.]
MSAVGEARLRDELCRIGRSLHARGYVHGTTGNLSARLGDGFLITATDACLGELEPVALVKVDGRGVAAAGAGRPSKTLALHRRIYAAAAEAGCVVHTHSRALVELSLGSPAGEDRADFLPPITPYFVMKVGHVPLLAYARPGDPAVADRVAAAIAEAERRGVPIRAIMLSRLGPNVWAETPSAAMARLEELEETARLWLAAEPKPAPLSGQQIEELRRHFGARW